MKQLYVLISLTTIIPAYLTANDAWIDSTIDLTINTKFDKALEVVKNQLVSDPQDYRAYFYIAATLNSRMTHFENQSDAAQFEAAIDSTIRIAERNLAAKDSLADSMHADLLFYLASAYGYLAYFQGRAGQWLPALSNGIKAANLFNETIEFDSTMYDAYLGIGTFKYWRYSKLSFISWLPFIPDDRDEGVALIRKCIAHHTRSRYLAMHQLTYILVDYDRTEEAVAIGRQLIRRYPDSQFMWWAAARAYEKNKDFVEAVSAYRKLMELLDADPGANPNHIVKCGLKLAEVYQLDGEYAECYSVCTSLITRMKTLDLPDKNDRLSNVTDLMNACRNNLPAPHQ
jgi:tetratricopeptide (TPR) repeat protein